MKNENRLQGYPMWWKLSLGVALAVIFVNFFSPKAAEQPVNTSMNVTYPAPWETEFVLGLSKSLAKNGVSGCGEYAYRKSIYHKSEYLLLCSPNGTDWVAYLVWPIAEEIIGPVTLSSDIKLPHIK